MTETHWYYTENMNSIFYQLTFFFFNPQPKQNSIAVLVENFQGSSSLSRVFNRSDQSHSEEHPQAGSDVDSDSDLVRALLMSLESEDINRNLQESSSKSQVHFHFR